MRGDWPIVQAPHAPPLIPEATNRKTVGSVGVAPEHITEVIAQVTVPSIGTVKRRRPPVTEAANVVEFPEVAPTAARPCSKTG